MPRNCQIPITRGINAGKLCHEVGRCRHVDKTCTMCDRQFTREETYHKHIKICKITSKDKDIKSEITALKESLHKLGTTTNINTTIIYQNNVIISDIGAFKTLCDKMGTNEATEFLCKLASKPHTIELFEKVFLDCDPSNYPIVNSNGKDFYYLDSENNVICDANGIEIAKLGDRLMKNVFIEAADPLLKRFVKQNDGDHEGDDNDYERFRELQIGASNFKTDRTFTRDLYPKTYNPNHPFFSKIPELTFTK